MNLFPRVSRFDNSSRIERFVNSNRITNWRIPYIAPEVSGEQYLTEDGIGILTEDGDALVTE